LENNSTTEIRTKETREDLLVPMMILAFLACAWLVYTYVNRNWLDAFDQVVTWIMNPTITYTSVTIAGVPWAFLATIEILFLGVTSAYLLLGNEKDTNIKCITSLGLGFGLTGLITIVLGLLGDLYQMPLNVTILLTGTILLSVIVFRKKRTHKLSFKEILTPHFSLPKISRPPNLKFWLPACIAIGVIFFFSFYHALLTIIVHWDATVYHAVMSVIMYNEHAFPVIAGPSIGLEMSANFPPLFSALGAYYYIQIGTVEDFFLRAIPPVMGLLTVLATYKIGEVIHSKKFGLIAALFLSVTPLFFRYSIYATSYSTLTFFCTISILFLLFAIVKGDTKYWILSGVFLGFALLTSYIAMYLLPFIVITLLCYFIQKKGSLKINVKKAAILLLVTVAIGGIWYVRNQVFVGNPIYPNAYTVLGGINIDPLIMNTTVNGIKQSAATSYFGDQNSFFDQIMIFLTYRTSFPAISLLTILALALLPSQNKKTWLIAAWPLSLALLVLSGVSWGFPRHMVFAMPGFALLSALPIMKALEICKKYDTKASTNTLRQIRRRFSFISKSNLIRAGIMVVLLVAFLFPSLTLVMSGKVPEENLGDQVTDQYLWFLEHPNADTWTVLNRLYPEAAVWQYINANLSVGEKVGTVENRIYYVKNCSNDYFFYLDGWEARELYNITDPTLMVQFLRNENVKIIVDVEWARKHGHFDILPMAKYLGLSSPFFPMIFNNNSNPAIYNVGPFKTPLTDNSSTLVSINQLGWNKLKTINGVFAQSIIAGNASARLYVATPNLTSINITYLDAGKDPLNVNIHNLDTENWTNGYATIQRNNTGKWISCELLVPQNERGYVELGLFASKDNFTVSRIDATPYKSETIPVAASLNSTLSLELTNKTLPERLMVYLPITNATEKVQVQTNSYSKNICLEIFEGIIQPGETTDWWTRYNIVTRTPRSIVYGVTNPSMVWEPEKPGYYTLIAVLRQKWDENAKVDLTITMLTKSNSTIAESQGQRP
jgi:4-amino-4-deoxy-L-arabinose transferase-like glycosyltransferase